MHRRHPNAPALLGHIRELARAELAGGVKSGFDALPQALHELEAASGNMAEQRIIAEAAGRARASREAILADFEKRFLQGFDARLDRGGPKPAAQALSLDELTLVDDGMIEDQIAIGRLRSKAMNELDADELLGVETRIGALLGEDGPVEREANPVDPDAALSALKHAIDAAADSGPVRATILNVLQPHLTLALRKLYFELNEQLIAAGIVPRLKHEIQRARDTGRGGAAGGAAAEAGSGRKRPDLSVSQVLSLRDLLPGAAGMPMDLGAIVASMLAAGGGSLRQGARMMANPEGTLYASALATPVDPEVLASLAQLQAAALVPVVPGAAPAAGAPPAVAGAGHAGAVVGAPLAGIAYAEAVQRVAGAHPLDQLTGELVGVVFDFVLGDRSVPDAVKAEVDRLRIAAFKAALLDRSFFARREHPVRRLLTRITELASDPELDASPEGAFVATLRAVVEDLNARFETDLAIFEDAIARIEQAAGEAARRQDAELERVAAELAERERAEQARATARAEVELRAGGDVPGFVAKFLREVWVPALALAELAGDAAREPRSALVQAMDDLVWSVAPKARADVPKLAALLPKLVPALVKGMQAANVPHAERDAFLEELMQAHTALLNAARAQAVPPPPAPKPAAPAPAAAPSPLGEFDAAAAKLGFLRLERGTVVEFGDADPPVRMKIGWVSPKRTLYAFRAAGQPPRSMDAGELAEAVKAGWLRVVETGESAFDRALAAAVGD
ncbi:MAG: DUF1631 domain-containing protein [Burkholderiales bacterium]|nr:DUF1631 domain-containing protein [Burkholderiales bacterium]